jgi:hypothetical protein
LEENRDNSIWEEPKVIVSYNGKPYTLTKIGTDISNEFDKPEGTVEMSHKIEGATEIPVYMVIDTDEQSFFFGHKVIEDGKDEGLFVSINDENLFNELCELVSFIEIAL